ncbi:hypothetical protein ACFQ5M_07730 [Agrilactobacillus yilanensis]|uniref:DUF4956 domain-containing protein n=1 Tax=Agrilactobacillus yilanensis TaxID=2485997 RepID=A0ABW4J9U6_9LACO|nr:hypothetical protein [Agrilactobacillus yilanensis]
MVFIIILDIGMIASAIYSVYWQSQLTIRARYNLSTPILGIVFSVWILATPAASNWPYVIAVSSFILVMIMDGVGGIGTKRLISTGFFSRVVPYRNFSEITLIPIDLPDGKSRVIAVFMTLTHQKMQLTFNQTVENLQAELEKYIPETVSINVENINQM